MDGVELARAIARRWPHIRALLATGYAASPIALDDLPIFGSLAKPFSGAELAEAVRTALDFQQIG